MPDTVFGIDLGTTYSAIAYINDFGQAEVIRNREGDETTPSVVFFESESSYVVGKEAKNGAVIYHENTVSLIKREVGSDTERNFFGKPYRPETVSSLILRDLVEAAHEATGLDTNKVVITVPAYFGLTEKEATRQAGGIAGLDVQGIVTEPVAAALSVGIRGDEPKSVFIYDLGGGTFDCTVMEVSSGKVEVIVIDGNRRLGGADWDGRLYDLVAEKFRIQADLSEDPTDDEDFAQRLLNEVETCKKTLSRKEKSTIRCSYADVVELIEVTRAEFEQATASLVEETLDIVQRALDSAKAKRSELKLDDVLLVGGASRMPMIQESLKARFGWNLRLTDFDLAVAKGAAIYAQGGMLAQTTAGSTEVTEAGSPDDEPTDKMLHLNGRAVTVKNVLSRGIGLRLIRDNLRTGRPEYYIGFLAHANESLPMNVEQTVYTYADGTTEVAIRIFEQQGERESEVEEHNKELTPESGATFTGLPYLPKGSPIDIKLFIDTEGLATLEAFEPQSAQNLEIGVRLSVMQTEDEARAKEIVASLSRRE
jgi:molecular chaperone DnaK